MGLQHAGRERRLGIEGADRWIVERARRARASICSRGRPPGRSSTGPIEAGDDGGFDADRGRPAIDDEIDAAAEIVHHVLRGGRRDMAGAVGGWRHDRPAEPAQDAERHRMLRHPHGDAVEARGGKIGDRTAGALLQHQRQRSRPERRGEPFGRGVEHREPLGGGEVEHMRDQRIERRPALGGVEPRHRRAVGGVGAEAVDGLGRKRDQAAVGEADRGIGDGDEFGGDAGACRSCRSFLPFLLRVCCAPRAALPDLFFAASTLIQSRLRSPSMFCSRSNSRAIAVRIAGRSAAGTCRASRRGRAAAPACP